MCKQEIVSKLKDSSTKSNNMPQIHLDPAIPNEAQFLNTQSTSVNISCLWSGQATADNSNSQKSRSCLLREGSPFFLLFSYFLSIFHLLSPLCRSLIKTTDRDKHLIKALSDTVEVVDLYLQLKKSALNHPAEQT